MRCVRTAAICLALAALLCAVPHEVYRHVGSVTLSPVALGRRSD